MLMQRERSFDHMCGFLKQQNPNIDGLTGKEKCPYNPHNVPEGSVLVRSPSPQLSDHDSLTSSPPPLRVEL